MAPLILCVLVMVIVYVYVGGGYSGGVNDDEFEVIGRIDNSDVRGCNLLI